MQLYYIVLYAYTQKNFSLSVDTHTATHMHNFIKIQ